MYLAGKTCFACRILPNTRGRQIHRSLASYRVASRIIYSPVRRYARHAPNDQKRRKMKVKLGEAEEDQCSRMREVPTEGNQVH